MKKVKGMEGVVELSKLELIAQQATFVYFEGVYHKIESIREHSDHGLIVNFEEDSPTFGVGDPLYSVYHQGGELVLVELEHPLLPAKLLHVSEERYEQLVKAEPSTKPHH